MTAAMSSPDRFGSLLRGLLKKNIPNMVYLTVIGFIGIPLPYLLAMFRRWQEQDRWIYAAIQATDEGGLYVGVAAVMVCLLWLAGTFILGLAGVGYMHNRRAVDLYHSLPVTRGQLLLGHLLTTFLTVAAPMTANTLLTAVLAAIRHGMDPTTAVFRPGCVALDLLGWYITAFAILVIVYLAATQVGSTFDTFLFSGVFLGALPVLYLAHMLMCASFLEGWNYDISGPVACSLSPMLTMIGVYACPGEWKFAALAVWLAAGALLLWVTVRLYIRRPSERAESRARQGFAVGLFKLIATFAGGLGFGTIFYMITGNGDSDGARLVWIAVFCLLVYFLVEAVLGRGFKGMARRSVVIGLGMAGLTVLYAGIVFAGGLGFEGRVPAAEKVTTVTLNYRGRYEYVPYYIAEEIHGYERENNRIGYSYGSEDSVTLRGREAVEAVTGVHRLIADPNAAGTVTDSEAFYGRMELCYTFSDGRTMKRLYYVYGGEEMLEAFSALEQSDEFQSRTNPLYYWTAEENPYREPALCDPTGLNILTLGTDDYDTAALVAALRQDLLAESATDYYRPGRRTVCYLYLQSEWEQRYSTQPAEKNFYGSFAVPVGEDYAHTLALLEQWGLTDRLTAGDWARAEAAAWCGDMIFSGQVIFPAWYGTDERNSLEYCSTVTLTREEAEALLPYALTMYRDTGKENYLCLYLERQSETGEYVFGLPLYIPLTEARRLPALTELVNAEYGIADTQEKAIQTALEVR